MAAIPARTRKRLLVSCASLVACLLLAEVAVRVTHGSPLAERLPLMRMRANPLRGWEMVPGAEHYTYQHLVQVNSLGLRGPELGAKTPGERRILYLGDSLVYGQGVGDQETQPAALERALRALDPKHTWTVVNAGHRSYGTAQELALLEELGARIQPDAVLLGWYWNDVNERDIAATYARLKDRGELYFDTSNRLEGWERRKWQARQLCRRSALVMLAYDLASPAARPYAPEYLAKVWLRWERQLARLRALCAALGARPILVLIPDASRIEGGEETRAFEERIAELARAQDLPVIELLPALVAEFARTGRLPVLPYDGHYDGVGNEVMAQHLAERMLALDLPRTE